MPIFMSQFSYTNEAWAALVKNPENRRGVLEVATEKFGGRLIAFYYCFGEYDGVVISEYPDETMATAAILGVMVPGHVKTVKTTLLVSVEQAVEAMKKAGTIAYTPPKG